MRLFPSHPPPLRPFRADAFSSSLRSPRVTSLVGVALGVCVAVCFLTGLYSHYQQHPTSWVPLGPAPVWLYRVTQGLHVATGLAAIPLLLLKLWTVYPRLFVWPPARSVLHVLERLSVFVLVATTIFQLATGVINNTQWYPWSFPFLQTHFAISFVIVGALLVHLGVKGPTILAALRRRRTVAAEAQTRASLSRRGFLVTGGLAVGAVTATTVGQTVAPLRDLAVLAPRRPDVGPQGLPVNRTAVAAGVSAPDVGSGYRLVLTCRDRTRELTYAELGQLQQHDVTLPIACVEGWSAQAQWRGIRISDLMALVGATAGDAVRVVSLERSGPYAVSELPAAFVQDPSTILALRLNGSVLDLDHGYPARIMAPNRPGVLQTKWVTQLEAR